ncbi:cytolethal distending toxin subunit A [Salmonella enterica subsp. salamae serovar 57:z29:z42]|uniref:hypothetical protein n=1 Tax=Salmonella enterica TaxID=28901 RepID=UPI000B7BEA33|nr:hypothetical protein [Salmonella enterica]ASO10847.1 cytolethal distending toxin subunit A [Salmonella enterica subsp. salamae serovar 57:z29:z42]ECI0415879.1 cytolethal distending toxin subunit A [Salmonella enterica subsp. salamae]EDW4021214.1 cytolethal distending toxin subunit A [Salmonella enterica subsp. salamae]
MSLMKRFRFLYIILFYWLGGCSSTPADTPVASSKPTFPSDPGAFPTPPPLPLPMALPVSTGSRGSVPDRESLQNQKLPVALMAQNGRVLTVWALGLRNWLWAYGPTESSSFGNLRNWNIEPVGTLAGAFRFINSVTGTCITAYKNGLIHDSCNISNTAQAFVLTPATNGGLFMRSVSLGKCVSYNLISHTVYSTVTLAACPAPGTNSYDQIWYLSPPLIDAIAE